MTDVNIRFIADTGDATKGIQNLANAGQKATENLNNTANAGRNAGGSMQNLGQALNQARQGIGVMENGLRTLVSTAGQGTTALNNTITSLNNVANAAAAGGAAFGPWGAIIAGTVAGLAELVSSLNEAAEAHERAARASEKQLKGLEALMAQISSENRMEELASGLRSVAEQTNALESAQVRLSALRRQQSQQETTLNAAIAQRNALIARRAEQLGIEASEVTRNQIAHGAMRAEYDRLTSTITRLRSSTQSLTSDIGSQQSTVIQLAGALRDAQQRERETRQEAERTARAHQRAQQAAAERARGLQSLMDLQRQLQADSANEEDRRRQEQLDREEQFAKAQAAIVNAQMVETERQRAQIEQELFNQRMARMAEEAERARRLRAEATTSVRTFQNSWRNGMDSVIESFRAANEASRQAGQGILDNARLIEEGMRAVGNSVVENIGNKFSQAFSQAIVAVVNGEKAFGEAMEDMAKSVLNALLQESIVQVIVETARAIASFASQNYGEGALHLAAAGTWAAVGIAAGAGSAALAGSGGKKAAPSAGSMATPPPQQEEKQGERVININYSNPLFANSEDVSRAIEGALRGRA